MNEVFRPYKHDQIPLMPALIRDLFPADHLAYFISDVVENLNMSAIRECYTGEDRGYPSLPPGDDGESAALRLLLQSTVAEFTKMQKEPSMCTPITLEIMQLGGSIDEHYHECTAEMSVFDYVVYVISGKIRSSIGDIEKTVGPYI